MLVLLLPLLITTESSFLSQDTYSRFEVPKTVFLKTTAGIMIILWILKDINLFSSLSFTRIQATVQQFLRNMRGTHLLTVGTLTILVTTIIASALSSDFITSLWGHQPGNDPFSLYSMVCYFAIFAIVASNLKSSNQVYRLLGTIILSGTIAALYGVLEFLGIDFLSVNETGGYQRISSTLGNSLIAGSYFLVSIGVTTTTIYLTVNNATSSLRWPKLLVSLLFAALLIQLTALIFTGSRGPWIATTILLTTFFFTGFIFSNRRTGFIAFGIVSLAICIAMALSTGLTNLKNNQGSEESAPQSTSLMSESPLGRASSIPTVAAGGLNGRTYTWSTGIKVALERPPIPEAKNYGNLTRFLVGHGPEMMEFAFLTSAPPYGALRIPATPDQAHNIIIHYWIEQGVLGLIASLFLFAVPAWILVLTVKNHRLNGDKNIWICVGLCVTLVGYAAEQQVGVSKVSGMMLHFAILGIIHAALSTNHFGESGARANAVFEQSVAYPKIIQGISVVCLATIVFFITFNHNINYLRSGFLAAEGVKSYATGNWKDAYTAFNRSITLSPRIPFYYHYQNAAITNLTDYIGKTQITVPPQCSIYEQPDKIRDCMYSEIYVNAKRAYTLNGYNWNTTFEAASAAYNIKQDSEALSLYNTMLRQAPRSYPLKDYVGYIYFSLGDYENAELLFRESLEITGRDTIESRMALMYIGLIQSSNGQWDEAYSTLLSSLERYLEARETGDGFGSDPQENQDILTISLELNNIAKQLNIEPPIKIQ
jgi:tetratricopeptide (TPR) repeat protein